jgi:alkylhydroperoxidase family enzyme
MRIAPVIEPYDDATSAQLTAMMPPGEPPIALFRTMARNPELTNAMHRHGSYMLSKRLSVDMRTREIVIDRTCARCGCDYEFGVHIGYFADRVGLTAEQVRSLATGGADDPCWTEARERAVIRLVDELHDHSDVDDPLWHELRAHFSDEQLLDLVVLTGWYHTISFLARAARVPLEPGRPVLR